MQYQCEIQTAYRREDVLSRVPTGLHLATANSALLFNDRIIFPFLAPSYLSKHIAWTGGNFFVGSFQSLAGKGQHCSWVFRNYFCLLHWYAQFCTHDGQLTQAMTSTWYVLAITYQTLQLTNLSVTFLWLSAYLNPSRSFIYCLFKIALLKLELKH